MNTNVDRNKIKGLLEAIGQTAEAVEHRRATAKGDKVPAMLSPVDLKILLKYRYGTTEELKNSLNIRTPKTRIDEKIREAPQLKDAPDWLEVLGGELPTFANGKVNPEFFKKTLLYLISKSTLHLDEFGERLDLSPMARQLIETAKQFGFDLTDVDNQANYDWLKDKDLFACSRENVLAVLREIRKIRPQSRKEETLKKKWMRLLVVLARMQDWARRNEHVAWTCIGRTQETGEVFYWDPIHIEMAETYMSGKPYLVVVPSGHGKTNLLLGLRACLVGRLKSIRIVFVLHGMDVSKRVQYVRQVVESRRFQAVYPDVRIDPRKSDSITEFSIVRDTPSIEPSIQGKGVRQKVEGLHADIIDIDDPHGREVAWSDAEREADLRAIDDTWVKRINPGCPIGFTQTRWHDKDVAGVALARHKEARQRGRDEDAGSVWSRMRIYIKPVPYKTDENGRKIPVGTLCPKRFPLELLEDEARENPQAFSRDRCCDPCDASSGKVSFVRYYAPERVRGMHTVLDRWISIDPAVSDTKTSCNMGWTQIDRVIRSDGKRRAILTDAGMHRRKISKLAEFLLPKFEAGIINYALVETKGAAKEFLPAIRTELGEYGHRLIYWEGLNISKGERLESCSILFEGGYVLFPGSQQGGTDTWEPMPHIAWLVQHILRFDSVADPDGVDSLTQWLIKFRDWLMHSEESKREERKPKTQADLLLDEFKASITRNFDQHDDGNANDELQLLEI